MNSRRVESNHQQTRARLLYQLSYYLLSLDITASGFHVVPQPLKAASSAMARPRINSAGGIEPSWSEKLANHSIMNASALLLAAIHDKRATGESALLQ